MQHVHVAAGIIWHSGRFLAALRPSGKPRAGFWEFPGGKQEPGENMTQTLCRELHEELGIHCGRVVPWRVVDHAYPDLLVTLHFMHVLDFTGVPAPNDMQELRWVTPEEALLLNFLPADRGVLPAIRVPSEADCATTNTAQSGFTKK